MLTLLLVLFPPATSVEVPPGLSSPHWHTRDRAYHQLLDLPHTSHQRLLKLSRQATDPEVSWRLWSAHRYHLNQLICSWRPMPMLDALWYDPGTRSYDVLKPIAMQWGPVISRCEGPGLWGRYRSATELWVFDEMGRGVPWEVVRLKLYWMHCTDRVYLLQCGSATSPDLPFTRMKVNLFP